MIPLRQTASSPSVRRHGHRVVRREALHDRVLTEMVRRWRSRSSHRERPQRAPPRRSGRVAQRRWRRRRRRHAPPLAIRGTAGSTPCWRQRSWCTCRRWQSRRRRRNRRRRRTGGTRASADAEVSAVHRRGADPRPVVAARSIAIAGIRQLGARHALVVHAGIAHRAALPAAQGFRASAGRTDEQGRGADAARAVAAELPARAARLAALLPAALALLLFLLGVCRSGAHGHRAEGRPDSARTVVRRSARAPRVRISESNRVPSILRSPSTCRAASGDVGGHSTRPWG